jgi:hypothetical protein
VRTGKKLNISYTGINYHKVTRGSPIRPFIDIVGILDKSSAKRTSIEREDLSLRLAMYVGIGERAHLSRSRRMASVDGCSQVHRDCDGCIYEPSANERSIDENAQIEDVNMQIGPRFLIHVEALRGSHQYLSAP